MKRCGHLGFGLAFAALLLPALLYAKEDPVHWTLAPAGGKAVVAPGGTAYFELKASIDPGWHLYSPTTPPGGPIITKVQVTRESAYKKLADLSSPTDSQA
jgi:hypothetical protein